ncbi:MAG: hypothetical protein ABFD84_11590 [Candidatus Polarisedimenticolia bacterium]|nr:hypothetical protein [bacterium]
MRRLLLSFAALLLLVAPMWAEAGDCRRLSITQCEWGGSVQASVDGMALAAETSAGLMKVVFHAQSGTLRIEAVPGRDGLTSAVKLSFHGGRAHAEASLDLAAAATGDYSSVAEIAGILDPAFLSAADALLETLPKGDQAAMSVYSLGRAVTASLARPTYSAISVTIKVPVLYTICYWSCVAGSGEWQGCGNDCWDKYGNN